MMAVVIPVPVDDSDFCLVIICAPEVMVIVMGGVIRGNLIGR
jgi:hypothetical protein